MKDFRYKMLALVMAIALSVTVSSSDALMNAEAGHTIVATVMHQSTTIQNLSFWR